MKNLTLLILFSVFTASCQDYGKLKLIADLPGSINEVSGIEKFPNQEIIWTINDSRNPPEVYGYSLKRKKIVQTLRLLNAPNIDWEDLAISPSGILYVGNFGNNVSNRTDLAIYAIRQPGNIEKRRMEPSVTTFHFEDQVKFPPKKKNVSFDVEAFIFLEDHFYLFTRNRAKKYDGKTKIYKVPAKEGDFVAKHIGSFKTCEDQSDCEITGAAIHEPTGKIALLSYNKVWIFSDYTEDDFMSGEVQKIKLGHRSQKESICFVSENELYIADERSRGEGGNLYSLTLEE
ncbi:MAG: hypothetical protein AAF489_00595 [Bacteroidota bacterium]